MYQLLFGFLYNGSLWSRGFSFFNAEFEEGNSAISIQLAACATNGDIALPHRAVLSPGSSLLSSASSEKSKHNITTSTLDGRARKTLLSSVRLHLFRVSLKCRRSAVAGLAERRQGLSLL